MASLGIRAVSLTRIALASALCIGAWGHAYALSSTACDNTLYVSNAKDANSKTFFNKIDTSTNPPSLSSFGSAAAANNYNALGYNPKDGYFYAMKRGDDGTRTLFRIDNEDGTVAAQWTVSSLPMNIYTSGAFDLDGNYYIKEQGSNNAIFVVNVNTRAFAKITLSQPIDVSDMAFVNGVLYSVGNNGQLYRIDITESGGTVTAVGEPYDTAQGTQLGAQFGATNGLFGTANDGSGLYYIDVATGIRTKLSDSPVASSNDGANCPDAALEFPADLSITKTASGNYVAGRPLVYTIEVHNEGVFDVTDAHVTDVLPAGITSASWTCTATGAATCGAAEGTGSIDDKIYLPYKDTVTYTLSMDVPADFTGELSNTADVALPGNAPYLFDGNPDNNTATATSVQSKADLGIAKTDGSGSYVPGTSVTYTITATNNGPDAVTGATVSDPLPAGITEASWTCVASGGAACAASGSGALNDAADLPMGGTATYTVIMSVPSGFAGDLVNTATVDLPGLIDENPDNNAATDTDAQSSANLGINKTDGNTSYLPGTDVTYTITVTNAGPDAANGATVSDPLPSGISTAKWTCAAAGGASCTSNGTGALNDKVNLPMGGMATYTLVMSVPATFTGDLKNTATVTSPPGVIDANPADNASTDVNTQSTADLSITKTDGQSSYKAGSDVTYTITVTNAGPDAANGATVSDPLPSGISTAKWTCAAAGGASCTGSGTGALNDDKVNLPKGGSATYTLVMSVPATFKGALVNMATVKSPQGVIDPDAGNDTATDSDAQSMADLSISKTDGQSSYKPGSDVTYTITVKNAGPDAADGATVSDLLPSGISTAKWTCAAAGGATCAASGSGALSDTVNLPAGATATYTLVMSVPATFTGELVNTASVTLPADVIDPDSANNSATDTDTQLLEAATPVPVGGTWMLLMLTGLLGWLAMRGKARHHHRG